MGFAALRQHVPNLTQSKKMSKVDTLRSAVDYIKSLQELLEPGHERRPSDASTNDDNHREDREQLLLKHVDGYYLPLADVEVSSAERHVTMLASETSGMQLHSYCGEDDSQLMEFCQPWLL